MHFSCGIVRPPYEAGSCFLQVTSGCSHNKCRFCTFYKEAPFSVSPESEIREDLQEIRDSGWKVKRIFLQGADPFLLSYDRLKRIMDLIKEYLPWGVSVGGYGRVDSVKNKSVEQLRSLREMGYDMIVFGIESGDDAVLDKMNKGYHANDIVEQLSKRYQQCLSKTYHQEQAIPPEEQVMQSRVHQPLSTSHLHVDHDRSKQRSDPLGDDGVEWRHDRTEIPDRNSSSTGNSLADYIRDTIGISI